MILRRVRRRSSRSDSRDAVLAQLPTGSVGAEVGVWKGDFAARILEVVKPSRLHLVDPWVFRDDYPAEAVYAGRDAHSQADMDAIYQQVVDRFAEDDRVVIHRVTSPEAGTQIEDLDWVYIDGDHTYEATLMDLEFYASRSRIICGDDYGVPGWWEDGVTRAVDEFVARDGRKLRVLTGGQYILA